MQPRTELQTILEGLLNSDAVYFQPPPTVKMVYPCIVYHLTNLDTSFANNAPYNIDPQYKITVIDKDPDSIIPYVVAGLPKCIFDRFYTSNNLNHFVFNLYF